MTSGPPDRAPATLGELWRQFLPLSLSDVTMMASDPLVTMTLAHLPDARANLAAVGVAKSLAVFFESPIIMVLHASNALAGSTRARRALWRFVLVSISTLSGLMLLLSLESVFRPIVGAALGVHGELADRSRAVLGLMILWPAAIGWRRYFQGLLIHAGFSGSVGRAGVLRIAFVVLVLLWGFDRRFPGAQLAALALVGGVVVEALAVTVAAVYRGVASAPDTAIFEALPRDVAGVWRFYWPLAISMLVVWGGRALLVGIVARAVDGPAALAAWPAGWGIVLLIANATRMVQQVIIKHRATTPARTLWTFAMTVGLSCTGTLAVAGGTPAGHRLLSGFVGGDPMLTTRVTPVVLVCAAVPFLVSLQNAAQGFLIAGSQTDRVNRATWVSTTLLLSVSAIAVGAGLPGALAAAIAMLVGLSAEIAVLAADVRAAAENERRADQSTV